MLRQHLGEVLAAQPIRTQRAMGLPPHRIARHALRGALLPVVAREFGLFRMLAFGAAMVLIMVWRPQGLLAHREPTMRLHPAGAKAGKGAP